MEFVIIFVIILIFFAALGNKQPKVRIWAEIEREEMQRYRHMPLKEYWHEVEAHISNSMFTNNGALEWVNINICWRGNTKDKHLINLLIARANIEWLSTDMFMDDFAVFYFKRLCIEHGDDWYVKCKCEPRERLENETLRLYDENENIHTYFMHCDYRDYYKRNENREFILCFQVRKHIKVGFDYEIQELFLIPYDELIQS